jgi:hypothetical protein
MILLKLLFACLIWNTSAFYIKETATKLKSSKPEKFLNNIKLNTLDSIKDENGFPLKFTVEINDFIGSGIANGTEFVKIEKNDEKYPISSSDVYTTVDGVFQKFDSFLEQNKEVKQN